MNYTRLKFNLLKYGRDNNFAYVCDSYKPELRADKKYRQWKRLLNRVTLLSMTPREREVLHYMLEVKAISLQEEAKKPKVIPPHCR